MKICYNEAFLDAHRKVDRFSERLTFHPHARELSGLVIDGNSVLRNTVASLAPAMGTLINVSAVGGGILGVPNGLSWARDALMRGGAALGCGHMEGALHHGLAGVSGLSYAGISGMMTAEGIMGLNNTALLPGMSSAFSGFGFAMYGALALYGAHGLAKTHSFGKNLEAEMELGEHNVLKWLKNQICLNSSDLWEIDLTSEDAEKEIQTRLAKKWSEFELRTGSETAKSVREKLPLLIKHFDLKEANQLIAEVEKGNFKQQVKYALFVIIALLGLAAMIALVILAGPASPALFAIGAAVWLTVDSSKLHNYIGEKCWTWHRGDKEPVLPCHKLLKP